MNNSNLLKSREFNFNEFINLGLMNERTNITNINSSILEYMAITIGLVSG